MSYPRCQAPINCTQPAAYYCEDDSIFLCIACSAPHRQSHHMVRPFDAQSVGNSICSKCHHENAYWTCLCDRFNPYCERCMSYHVSKAHGGSTESVLPWDGDVNKHLINCKRFFEGAMSDIEAAEKELEDKCNAMKEAVDSLRRAKQAELIQIRSQVNSDEMIVTNQLKRGLTASAPIPFVSLLRTRESSAIPPMFRYEFAFPALTAASAHIEYFPLNHYHEAPLQMPFLPIVRESQTVLKRQLPTGDREVLSFHTQDWPSSQSFWTMGFCLRDQKTLFCVGKTVFSLDLGRREKTDYPSRHADLVFPGVCIVEQLLYVFGGRAESERTSRNSADLLNPDNRTWSRLPTMITPRSRFNPAPLQRAIYLIGGEDSAGKIEKYGVDSQAYSAISVVLKTKTGYPTTSLVVDRTIVILSSSSVYRLQNDWTLQEVSSNRQSDHKWAQLAVAHEKDIYFYRQVDSTLEVFKLDQNLDVTKPFD